MLSDRPSYLSALSIYKTKLRHIRLTDMQLITVNRYVVLYPYSIPDIITYICTIIVILIT